MLTRGNAIPLFCDRGGHFLGVQSHDGTVLVLGGVLVDKPTMLICPFCLLELERQHLPPSLARKEWHPSHHRHLPARAVLAVVVEPE